MDEFVDDCYAVVASVRVFGCFSLVPPPLQWPPRPWMVSAVVFVVAMLTVATTSLWRMTPMHR